MGGSAPRSRPRRSALLTDLYEITMGYAYWKSGLADREAVFHLVYRKNDLQSGDVDRALEEMRDAGVVFVGADAIR